MTIYDIAKLAGVSYATVSRVINNRDGVKKETREKVQKILDEYDYLPNSFARGLVKNEMKIIGINIIDVRNIHYTYTAFHIEQELAKFGYSSIISGCGDDETKQEEYIRVMAERNVDGLVLIGSKFQNDITKKCIIKYFREKPVVIANGFLELDNTCGIILDERKAVSDVVDYLVNKGHKHIALIQEYRSKSSREKQAGFIDGLRKNNIDYNEKNIRHIDVDMNISEVDTQNLLMLNKNITAIIYGEDIMAVGGIKACNNLKLNVPKDINIIGFDNSIYSEISTPKISSIDNKSNEIAEKCTKVLYNMLMGEKIDPIVKLTPQFVIKESTN